MGPSAGPLEASHHLFLVSPHLPPLLLIPLPLLTLHTSSWALLGPASSSTNVHTVANLFPASGTSSVTRGSTQERACMSLLLFL